MKIAVLLVLLAQYQHTHPPILPTDTHTWESCCHEHDCMEAQSIKAQILNEDYAMVTIDAFEPFRMWRKKIHPSQNGKAYFCRMDIGRPPAADNMYCVFIVNPNSV